MSCHAVLEPSSAGPSKDVHRQNVQPVHTQQGIPGADFRSLGPVASIGIEIKISWCNAKGYTVQNHWNNH